MKNLHAILLFSVIIFLVGCTSTVNTQQVYHIGTEGIVIEFAKSNPKGIYEGEEFGTALFIKNIGSYDVSETNPAILKISYDDYRIDMISGYPDEIEIRGIHGKSIEYPTGEEAPVETYFQSKRLTHLREGATTYINYNLCYPYVTQLTTMTCIDTKLANRDESAAACASEDYNGAAGQGAPIVITKIQPEIMLQTNYVRPQFKIYIENRGTGYVTSSNRCENGETNINDRMTSGFVNVEAQLSGVQLECGPDNEGVLRLIDSESFIRCYLPAGVDRYTRDKKNYITPLSVELSYTYVYIEEQKIEIKRDEMLDNDPGQGLCGTYEIEFEEGCITKCEYCDDNPGSSLCQENEPYAGFNFGGETGNFSCTCGLTQCNDKLSKGNCIKGYCPGSMYCCSSAKCDMYQVEVEGRCVNKCEYCAGHPRDILTCGAGFNFSGFSCRTMNSTKCGEYSTYGACIFGYCGGAGIDTTYCANENKMQQILQSMNLTNTDATGSAYAMALEDITNIHNQQNLCEYCAMNSRMQMPEDERCRFENNGVIAKIDGSFRCSCDIQQQKNLESHKFVPESGMCDNGLYCCSNY